LPAQIGTICAGLGPLEFVCEWPALGIAESRAGIEAQLILDAAQRSIRLWPESEV
jgi:hypothetical protein